jgi:hypothetical protein
LSRECLMYKTVFTSSNDPMTYATL